MIIKNLEGLKVFPINGEIRNVLIIGITGDGKSSLANTLSNSEEFETSSNSVSITKHFKESDEFNWEYNENQYKFKLIDNIGFSDTKGESFSEQILYNIGESVFKIRNGINQILFVIQGKFTTHHITAFNLFKEFINDNEITKFTTIVRTKFKDFEDSVECENDIKLLLEENGEIKDLIESCNRIIYIDNPPIIKIKDNYKRERDKLRDERQKEINQQLRESSREIILNHLVEKCPNNYKLNWEIRE